MKKKIKVLDWYEPSRLSDIDYINEWVVIKFIRNERIVFKKQGMDINTQSLCSLFLRTIQFTCFPVSNNRVMNTAVSSRPNLHPDLASDTSNPI